MIKELQLTSGTKDEEFPSILQTVVFTVENGWCGGEEPRHVSEELRWRCQCHDFRPTDSSRASWPCLGGRRGFPARPDGGNSSQFRQFLSHNPANKHNPLNSPSLTSDHVSRGTHPCPATANSSLSCLRAVSWRTQRLQGMCACKKNPTTEPSSPHPLYRAFLAHAFQLRGLESRLWRQSRHLPSFRVFRPIPRLLLPDVCQRFRSLILLSDSHSQLLQ